MWQPDLAMAPCLGILLGSFLGCKAAKDLLERLISVMLSGAQ